ncbi:hypothetical protein ACGFZL_16545 [Streptomyces sp. NPDC048182]|uniref:hypothetical protein n=1 Tax=Streptomyces sp. NPDC048182 TaxID=3365507 RepID=UPI00371FC839
MGGHPMKAAITLCAAAALALPVSAASAAPAAQHTAARQTRTPVVVDCAGRPEVRPAAFVVACGDGNSRLTSLTWSRWDTGGAVGRGTNALNDCKPYCAAGTFRSYPVSVRLDGARANAGDPGERHYTQITLTYTDGRPAGFPRTVSYPLSG